MTVTDLARMYPRTVVEGSPHRHERKAAHRNDNEGRRACV
jgi:hypothetical protein